jgi:hypothetical protein
MDLLAFTLNFKERPEDEIFVWHFPVSIKLGGNVIEVDQHNAEIVITTNE